MSTSAIFNAWLGLGEFLRSIDWPGHPTTGETPSVNVGDLVAEPDAESIHLVGRADDPADQDWFSFGEGAEKDESFALRIVVYTSCYGEDGTDTVRRLAELVGLIESGLRSATSGRPIGLTFTEQQCIDWSVVAVDPAVFPSTEGWAGYCSVVVAFNFVL